MSSCIVGLGGPRCSHTLPSRRSAPLSRRRRLQQAGKLSVLARSGLPDVVLTREYGKNAGLEAILRNQGVDTLELPLLETAEGPDREELTSILSARNFGWITITSPEAAATFIEAWKEAGQPQVQIAVVGKGTGKVMRAASASLNPAFVPSKANAVHLAAELPLDNNNPTVLYPASAKAAPELQDALRQRGFDVTRLNTYDTLPVKRLDREDLALAKQAAVVAIASPSAIKAWIHFVGLEHASRMGIACIGSTSANAAQKLGLKQIHHPEQPGLEGFARSILEALQPSDQS